MSIAAASLDLDARALQWLDRLLDAPVAEREAELELLRREQPTLHGRLCRLLAASDDTSSSRALAIPLLAGLHAAAPTRVTAGERIAGWRLLRELGRGGMSVVWLAERAEGGLRREVAIKLPTGAMWSDVLAERFARERDVLASLDHPNIARLFDAGVSEDGQPYIVLEYIAGRPITEAAAGLPTRQRLALFQQMLAAVQHAHRHLVVHRDLKPGNILVNAEGQVKLLDFGIAKLLAPPADAAVLTQEAGSVLTPRYAAPEQVLAQPVSTATDVYSAGVVLYELLTGRLPYANGEAGVATLMQAVVGAEPERPGVSQDIDTVLLKALRKAPADRYTSIERFAEDCRRVLADEPILARRVPWWYRLRLLVRRHRVASALAALASIAVVVAMGVAWHQARETLAQKVRGDAVRDFIFSMMSDAEPSAGHGQLAGKALLDAAVARARSEFGDRPRLRGELLGELGRVYFRIQQVPASIETLNESLALLQASAAPDDPALNRTRAVLARSLTYSDPERAGALARQALADCRPLGRDCADARGHAQYSLGALAAGRGDFAESLDHARAMVREAEVAFAAQNADLEPALETLILAARNAGELREASAAVQRVRRLPVQADLRAANRDWLDAIEAALDVDLGRASEARALLAGLLQREASPNDRAAQYRVLAAADLSLGRLEPAMREAEQAQQVLPADAPAAARWLARLTWGEAASRAGQHAAALEALAAARAGLAQAGFKPGSPSALRAQRLHAEALLRAGRNAAAVDALRALMSEHDKLQPKQTVEAARTLDALGCALAPAHRPVEAEAAHADALQRYAEVLPPEHPLHLRALALRALAADRADAPQAVERWRNTLAADSPLRHPTRGDCSDLI
ncbi:MAG: serine/threonine-protein kinase [Caldimonas sp.]